MCVLDIYLQTKGEPDIQLAENVYTRGLRCEQPLGHIQIAAVLAWQTLQNT
jgi:hypothetical protein